MKGSVWCLICVVMLALTLAGCVTGPKEADIQDMSLQSSTLLRFEDIPYPAGFRMLPKKSFILESGGVRAGVIRYLGKADAQNVLIFYKEQMPAHNWLLLNVLEFGERMLNFERGNESCVVAIKQKGGKAEITISLAPKQPMPEKEARQIKVYEGK